MAVNYGEPMPQGFGPQGGLAIPGPMDGEFGSYQEDPAMLSEILGNLTAKITVETEQVPGDYSGVPVKSKTEEEVDLADLLPGPAPMMMSMGPPPPPMQQMQQPMMGAPMQQPMQQMQPQSMQPLI
tara:strand:+ start:417 stop:794 length:378 start_codon:yes stop_codon:yes gene_type:complete